MADFSEAYQEAIATWRTDVVLYDTIEISHPDWTAPIYVVNGFDSFTARLETGELVDFVAAPFELTIPSTDAERLPTLTLRIHDRPREVVDALEQSRAAPKPVRCVYRPYMSDTLDVGPDLLPPPEFYIKTVDIDPLGTIDAPAINGDLLNLTFPRRVYTLREFPGLARP